MKLTTLAVIVVFAGLLTACTEETEAPVVAEEDASAIPEVTAFRADPEAVARGEALFMGSCAEYCHTLTPAEGDASFLFDCQWQQGIDDAAIAEIIRSGIPDTRMVGFGSNFPEGDTDLWKLIAYLRANKAPCT